jgi:formiminoglutamase
MSSCLEVHRGDAPLIVTFPHTGTSIPGEVEKYLVSPWLARKDTDWWVHHLYDMTDELHATTVRTTVSRTVIDVNRDPSGNSLYPGMATTELCPLTTFDGEALYRPCCSPDEDIASRRTLYFEPYHAALAAEIQRLLSEHGCVVVYDAHSIRSRVPRLFEGRLPDFNIGTNRDTTCEPALTRAIEQACTHPRFTLVTNGRFRGGWTTRHYGCPSRGVHCVQMELACRSYLQETDGELTPDNWPRAFDPARAREARGVLARALRACLDFASGLSRRQ